MSAYVGISTQLGDQFLGHQEARGLHVSVSGSGDLAPSCTPCHPVLGHRKAPGTQGMLKVFGSEHSIFKGGFVVVFNLKHHLPLPPPHPQPFSLAQCPHPPLLEKSSKDRYQ